MSDVVGDRALDRLARAIPPGARRVCRVLQAEGHEACAVGGAVRDALLGRDVGDWDVTTSAPPEVVESLFPHTIPTGIEHGTVTVVIGRGRGREAIEVTTFRGEGDYSDARRPDAVTFGVPLDEDLARRDFVINAIAYDPIAGVIRDPFGGRDDLDRRLVRAVGDPARRFREDGLRVMRAVRFVAQLDFELDPETESAIPQALGSLSRVARERVWAELRRLLTGPAAPRALAIAQGRGVLAVALPEVAERIGALADARWERALTRVRETPADAPLRLASLLGPGDVEPLAGWDAMTAGERAAGLENREAAREAEAVMRGLRASSADRKRVSQLAAYGGAPRQGALDAPILRRVAGRVGRERATDLAALWRADAAAEGGALGENLVAAADVMEAIVARGDPIAARDLAISGGDLIDALGLEPGPAVGALVAELVEAVCDDPARNTREGLEALARARLGEA